MDHLDEVPGADRAGMDIALLDTGVAAVAAGGARDIADSRRQCLEDRIEPADHGFVAADHHAIAALNAPDAAGGADVDIMQPVFPERLAAADVVLPKGVAAVDDDILGLHQF